MLYPAMSTLLKNVDSRYLLVNVIARRARQISIESEITHEPRMDTAEVKRVELHLHTRMSNMDALTDTGSVVKLAAKWGMPAIAIREVADGKLTAKLKDKYEH